MKETETQDFPTSVGFKKPKETCTTNKKSRDKKNTRQRHAEAKKDQA